MNRRTVRVPLGRLPDHKPKHPERTSLRAGISWDSDYDVTTWPSRGAMLEACRMSEQSYTSSPLKPWPKEWGGA